MVRRLAVLATLFVFVLVTHSAVWKSAHSDCLGLAPGAPNVAWFIKDSVAACPAADTLTNSARPSRLRVTLYYEDLNCNPKVGVPPESIYVTTQIAAGNLKVNDEGAQVFADDSTDADGFARITIPSFSGCGKVRLRLFVSGGTYGTKTATVRTTDVNADGRVSSSEILAPCDLNYDGASNFSDVQLALYHEDHWHRNALFGTLVRRTNLSHAEGQPGAVGESQVFWSPSGRWLSYTIHGPSGANCHVFIVPSNPAIGNTPKQFTWLPDTSDYDPSWSPLNQEIAFGRADYRIVRKGIPGLNADTTDKLVAASGDVFLHGDLTPAISPDGQWVAFARKDQVSLDYHIWKAPISGGTPTQLTFTPGVPDQYPSWSPDGNWILFDREIGYPNPHLTYKVKANQVLPQDTLTTLVYSAGAGKDAATPAFTPDGLVATLGIGTHDATTVDVRTHTLDPALGSPKPILNYPDTTFAIHGPDPVLSPRLSPDGTRLALRGRQIWAARRNMNLPPAFTNLTSSTGLNVTLHDTTVVVEDIVDAGAGGYSATVTASDPEGDALTYEAFFLQPGMTWDAASRTLSWAAPGPPNADYYVKFRWTTASGGTDSFILKLHVRALGPRAFRAQGVSTRLSPQPIPSQGRILFGVVPPGGPAAQLTILDLAGRIVARISVPAGGELTWDGRGEHGALALPGVYLYRLELGPRRQEGKLVVVR